VCVKFEYKNFQAIKYSYISQNFFDLYTIYFILINYYI